MLWNVYFKSLGGGGGGTQILPVPQTQTDQKTVLKSTY